MCMPIETFQMYLMSMFQANLVERVSDFLIAVHTDTGDIFWVLQGVWMCAGGQGV